MVSDKCIRLGLYVTVPSALLFWPAISGPGGGKEDSEECVCVWKGVSLKGALLESTT